jgi:hypothetical protein
MLIVSAKNRFASDTFSVLSGVKSWITGLRQLVDILIGLPALKTEPYDQKYSDEYQKFLIAELKIHPDNQDAYDSLCQEIILSLKDKNHVMTTIIA